MAVPPPPYPEGRNLLANKTVVITAGEPFGQPGSTNSLRIETLH